MVSQLGVEVSQSKDTQTVHVVLIRSYRRNQEVPGVIKILRRMLSLEVTLTTLRPESFKEMLAKSLSTTTILLLGSSSLSVIQT